MASKWLKKSRDRKPDSPRRGGRKLSLGTIVDQLLAVSPKGGSPKRGVTFNTDGGVSPSHIPRQSTRKSIASRVRSSFTSRGTRTSMRQSFVQTNTGGVTASLESNKHQTFHNDVKLKPIKIEKVEGTKVHRVSICSDSNSNSMTGKLPELHTHAHSKVVPLSSPADDKSIPGSVHLGQVNSSLEI